MGRNILFITTDQQRYDALGCNGGTIAKTPVALPPDSPSVAAYLHEKAGYRTALLGKAHFEPAFDLQGRWFENRMAREDSTGPYRGFERMELAMHVPLGGWHYSLWLQKNHPEEM